MPADKSSTVATPRSAADIRDWIVDELSRSMNVGPETIDPAAPLHSLGADSLTAIGMTGALAGWLNRDLPATLMWDHASIDALAQALAEDAPPMADSSPPGIVVLQPNGDRRPLFCFPGMGGHPTTFAPLAERLAPDVPCYGLTVPGLNGEREPMTRLEDIATAVLANVRRVQANGPYQLAGYSFGGFLAYEMAQQLVAAGETVSLLAIYDSFTAEGRRLRPRWQRWALHAYHLLTRPGRRAYLRERWKTWRRRRFAAKIHLPPEQNPPPTTDAERQFASAERFALINRRAAVSYQPQPYPGSIVLFRATDQTMHNIYHKVDATCGWGSLARDGVHAVTLPGGHGTLLYGENSMIAASTLRPHLADGTGR